MEVLQEKEREMGLDGQGNKNGEREFGERELRIFPLLAMASHSKLLN